MCEELININQKMAVELFDFHIKLPKVVQRSINYGYETYYYLRTCLYYTMSQLSLNDYISNITRKFSFRLAILLRANNRLFKFRGRDCRNSFVKSIV